MTARPPGSAARRWRALVVAVLVLAYGLVGFPVLDDIEPERASAQDCPHGAWSSGRCRACPVGQVWITGTGCVVSDGCSSGNHRHAGGGCHRIGQSHTATTTTTAPTTTTTTPPVVSCAAGVHNHAYSPGWCHSDDHLTPPACHATERGSYRVHRVDSTHEYRYVEPCAATTTTVPPTTTTAAPSSSVSAVTIGYFNDASRSGAGRIYRGIRVEPDSASCEASRASGISATVEVLATSGLYRVLIVDTGDATGSVTVSVTCEKQDYVSATVTAKFTAVGVSGLDGASRDGAGTISEVFSVAPNEASCATLRVSGISVGVSVSENTASSRELRVDTTGGTGTAVVSVTCSYHRSSDSATASYTARPYVGVNGLADMAGTGVITASFTVVPDSTTCTAERTSGPSATVSVSGPSRVGRRVSVTPTGSGAGIVVVRVVCSADGYVDTTRTVDFTIEAEQPTTSTGCTTPLGTLGSQTITQPGTWSATSSCRSSQRGDDQTSYYAHHYTFTLDTDTTLTITVTPATSTDPRPVLYVLSATASAPESPETDQPDKYELTAGGYIIEVTTTTAGTIGNFTLSISTATAACPSGEVHMPEYETGTDDGCRPVCTSSQLRDSDGYCRTAPVGTRYRFAQAIIAGARAGARAAIDSRTDDCATRAVDPVTVNQLAALMLAIPIREVGTDPSRMTLSRADADGVKEGNYKLYSRGTFNVERRAHWNPGVGPWQIDIWDDAKSFNHAERANVDLIVPSVAKRLLPGLCSTPAMLDAKLGPWYGCRPRRDSGEVGNQCVRVYGEIYDAATGGLFVQVTGGSDPDGGVEHRRCRWDSDVQNMPCYFYDMTRAEGTAHTGAAEGNTKGQGGMSPTPLAAPFVSFTDPADDRKYAVFAASVTDYAVTLIRGVPMDKFARQSTLGDGNGWFVGAVDGKVLYMETCGGSGGPADAVSCVWTRQ